MLYKIHFIHLIQETLRCRLYRIHSTHLIQEPFNTHITETLRCTLYRIHSIHLIQEPFYTHITGTIPCTLYRIHSMPEPIHTWYTWYRDPFIPVLQEPFQTPFTLIQNLQNIHYAKIWFVSTPPPFHTNEITFPWALLKERTKVLIKYKNFTSHRFKGSVIWL